ncbi:strictosidine synthase family protein [Parvibaculum sp.]|uniref:strictosidine synthase family protein n=1 Tax=Parvibaculum sp. TaxID=2024848 RepID=UPI002BDBF057|nr:SMP-30/gluconolactonase/LRE family protein [Parvibaculum sp.]HUD52893.1 SMP-30/gluconolactonase/LRE family protein [Parvibaculum sp.]
MSRLLRNVIIGLVVAVCIVSVLGWRFLSAAGYFTGIRAEVPADCTEIASVPGPEDIAIDRERGLAYVGALDWRAMMRGDKAVRGGIYVIDLKAPRDEWALAPVTPNEPADFKPHGISLYIGADGKRRLFVVNHAEAGNAIEIFDIAEDGTLAHVKSVADPLLVSPNDVVAVGPDAFYATNDHGSKGVGAQLSDLLLLRNANVVYYDGTAMRKAADMLLFPNGINVSPDGATIYVAESLGAALHVYTRDPATGALTARDYTRLGTGLDNIDVEPDGSLLIAAHPNMLAFIRHASDPKHLSPSQVVRIEPGKQGGGKAGTIYLNLGEQLSGSSVAAGYNDLMLIGNVFEKKILVCKQTKEFKSF